MGIGHGAPTEAKWPWRGIPSLHFTIHCRERHWRESLGIQLRGSTDLTRLWGVPLRALGTTVQPSTENKEKPRPSA